MTEVKPINNLNRIALKDAVPLDTPFSVWVFPTTYCNFKCIYCAHSMSREGMEEAYNFVPQTMEIDTYVKIMEQLKEFPRRVKLLSLTGHGEPMLNKRLPKMVQLAKEANIADRIEIITNASLLTPALTDALVNAGLDGLRVSIQGLNANKYKEVCGWSMDFDEYISNLRYFNNNKKSCELLVKVLDVTLEDGEDELFYKLFDGMCDRMYIEKCRNVYEGVDYTRGMTEDTLGRYGNYHEPFKVCPLSFFQMGIFPDGDVEPCDTIYKPILLGNVYTDTLQNMFLGEKMYNFRMAQLKQDRFVNPKCAVCTAPDDVSMPEDRLDDGVEAIIQRMKRMG